MRVQTQATEPNQRLKETRGEHYPVPGAGAQTVVDFVRRLLRDGDSEASGRYKRSARNLLFADGRQHVDWNKRDKSWRDAPTPNNRPRPTLNYMRPILRARLQRMLSSEVNWRVVPDSNAHESRDKAMVATNVLESRWSGTDMDAKLRNASWLACSCGVAYLKQFWNPDVGDLTAATIQARNPLTGQMAEYPVTPDGQPLFDPETGEPVEDTSDAFTYRTGDSDSSVRSLFNVRLNPDAFGLSPAEGFRWLIDSEVIPISVVKERYGEAAKDVQTVEGVAQLKQFEGLIRSIGGRGSSKRSRDLSTNRDGGQIPDKELTLLSEYWEGPSDSLPGGRLIVVAGDVLLYDDVLPQGIVPYVPIYDERRPFDAYGRGSVDDLIDPQKIINKQWALILEEMALSGPGQWAMFDVPGLSEQITNLSGAHIKVPMASALANRGIGDLVQRIPSGQVPADRWRLVEAALNAMYTIGAFNDVQRGQVPTGVESGGRDPIATGGPERAAPRLGQDAQGVTDPVGTSDDRRVSLGLRRERAAVDSGGAP